MDQVVDIAVFVPPCRLSAGLAELWHVDGQAGAPGLELRGTGVECPITLQTITSPVLLADGSIYEQVAILQWLRTTNRSPCTNLVLPHTKVLALDPFKTILEDFLRNQSNPPPSARRGLVEAMHQSRVSKLCASQRLEQLESSIAAAVAEIEELRKTVLEAQRLANSIRNYIEAQRTICVIQVQSACKMLQSQELLVKLQSRRIAASQVVGASRRFSAQSLILQLALQSVKSTGMAKRIQQWWRCVKRKLAKRGKRRRLRQQRQRIVAATRIQKLWKLRITRVARIQETCRRSISAFALIAGKLDIAQKTFSGTIGADIGKCTVILFGFTILKFRMAVPIESYICMCTPSVVVVIARWLLAATSQ